MIYAPPPIFFFSHALSFMSSRCAENKAFRGTPNALGAKTVRMCPIAASQKQRNKPRFR